MNYKQRSKSFNFDFSQNNSFPSPAVNVNLANLSRHSMSLKGLILMELKRIIFLLSSDKSVVNSIKPVLLSEIPMTIFFLLLHEKCFPRIWSHLLKKSLMENFIFCAVFYFIHHCCTSHPVHYSRYSFKVRIKISMSYEKCV